MIHPFDRNRQRPHLHRQRRDDRARRALLRDLANAPLDRRNAADELRMPLVDAVEEDVANARSLPESVGLVTYGEAIVVEVEATKVLMVWVRQVCVVPPTV